MLLAPTRHLLGTVVATPVSMAFVQGTVVATPDSMAFLQKDRAQELAAIETASTTAGTSVKKVGFVDKANEDNSGPDSEMEACVASERSSKSRTSSCRSRGSK